MPPVPPGPQILALAATLALAGCVSTGPAPRPASSAAESGTAALSAPSGPAGCAGPLGDYQAVIANDVATGHLNKGVHARVAADLAAVRAACAAGREVEANRALAAAKARYGYR